MNLAAACFSDAYEIPLVCIDSHGFYCFLFFTFITLFYFTKFSHKYVQINLYKKGKMKFPKRLHPTIDQHTSKSNEKLMNSVLSIIKLHFVV